MRVGLFEPASRWVAKPAQAALQRYGLSTMGKNMATTGTDLFRAIGNADFKGAFHVDGVAVDGLLYPRFKDTPYVDHQGVRKTSKADVFLEKNAETGELEVQPGRGTSLHDVEGWFGHAHWRYFQIPEGTEYSEALHLHKSKKQQRNNRNMQGWHYQIEPKNPMTADALKGALDNFARNAIVRSIELSQSK